VAFAVLETACRNGVFFDFLPEVLGRLQQLVDNLQRFGDQLINLASERICVSGFGNILFRVAITPKVAPVFIGNCID
jgi:hypothetical protein